MTGSEKYKLHILVVRATCVTLKFKHKRKLTLLELCGILSTGGYLNNTEQENLWEYIYLLVSISFVLVCTQHPS